MKTIALMMLLATFASSKSHACDEYADYDVLLSRYAVDGRVDYAAWHGDETDREKLDQVVAELEDRTPSEMEREDALVYWINLYNAVTLKLILDHHPVDSIKDIGGFFDSPWKRELVTVEGQALSLDDIENEIIRPRFGDARIHFALNCAAVSCPPLQSAAFCGEKLDAQLEGATRRAVREDRFVDASDCTAEGGTLRLSKIFDWYRDDFEPPGLVEFVNRYSEKPVDGKCDVEFLGYDWKLNGQ